MSRMGAGHFLCAGFQGTSVTQQARDLIIKYKVSTMILSRKNATSTEQLAELIQDLQYLAYTEGEYEYPLMLAVDAEGGMMNTLFDPENIIQVPGAMALAATGDAEIVYEASRAVAVELKALGFLIVLGPVLDVVMKMSDQLLGVRSFGTTVDDVVKYGMACARGLKDGGVYTFGKHFPGIGNAMVDSFLEVPILADTLDQLKSTNIIPFTKLLEADLLDGISAAGCAVPTISPEETHACLSPVIVNQLLRSDLNFNGVVISECLEMDALHHSIGLGQGVIMAISAGCDLVMVCHDLELQKEAFESLTEGMSNNNVKSLDIYASFNRILSLQMGLPSWEKMFENGKKQNIKLFKNSYPDLWKKHQKISEIAYQKSISVVRDYGKILPITKNIRENSNILLLTPLLNPIYPQGEGKLHFSGEEVFQKFGSYLAEHSKNKGLFNVLHTTYTANGLTSLHESLIENSSLVIVVTSEASRNLYQIGIVKYVSILCGGDSHKPSTNLVKPLIMVATLSPYDFYYNKGIGSAYLCCYDYTDNALRLLAGVLMGDLETEGSLPGERRPSFKSKRRRVSSERRWLVEEFQIDRDWRGLVALLKEFVDTGNDSILRRLKDLLASNPQQKHFVVRNSSLGILYGIIITWVDEEPYIGTGIDDFDNTIGSVRLILVDKLKVHENVGRNLYDRAIKYLIGERNCVTVNYGGLMPQFPTYEIPPVKLPGRDWVDDAPKRSIMMLYNMSTWQVPTKIFRELMIVGVRFDTCSDTNKLLPLIEKFANQEEKKLYLEAIAAMNKDPNTSSDARIIISLEPTNQNVIGSIIMFNSLSPLSKYFPFISEANTSSLVGVIACPIVDTSYSTLQDIFVFGLVCSAITFLRSNEDVPVLDDCMLVGSNQKIDDLTLLGFTEWKTSYDFTLSKEELAIPE